MITTNTGAKKIEGTDNWREIFDAHNDSVNAHDKVSEAMTYVVNGNKSIENAAIPVGSYVRLANSTIVGRSDGIYTVKTAIPVNTVIDSSYFNENAPIAGGVANALNSKIGCKITYHSKSITFTGGTKEYSNYTDLGMTSAYDCLIFPNQWKSDSGRSYYAVKNVSNNTIKIYGYVGWSCTGSLVGSETNTVRYCVVHVS